MAQRARLGVLVILFFLVWAWTQGQVGPGSKAAPIDWGGAGLASAGQSSSAIMSPEPTSTPPLRPPLPTIHYFSCIPCAISKGEQATLSWDLSGAIAAYLDGQGVTAPGSTVVAPDQTTTYRLVAVGDEDSVERLVTVTVIESGDPETVRELLLRPGYDVRWVGYLPLAEGGDTISVIMAAVAKEPHSEDLARQYFEGFRVLLDGFPGQLLTVGLCDGARYTLFATVESAAFEAFLRGEVDGAVFWQATTWNVWDDWAGRWLDTRTMSVGHKDFESKDFGF